MTKTTDKVTRLFFLLSATMIWGLGFAATRWTLLDYTPMWSNTIRFLFVAVCCLPLFIVKDFYRHFKPALLCGVLLAAALQLQTYGIAHTSLAKSGFLTAFYAVFTPLMLKFFFKYKFRKAYWLLLALALLGIALLCELSVESFNKGDAYILLSAIFFSGHIIAVDRVSNSVRAFLFNMAQGLVIAAVCIPAAFLIDGPPDISNLFGFEQMTYASPLVGFLVLSLFSYLIAFSLQVEAQKEIPAHVASLIFLAESIFATIFGYLFFKEVLSGTALLGGLCVLVSVALLPMYANLEKQN